MTARSTQASNANGSHKDVDLSISVTQEVYPRYTTSGLIYHQTIEKTKHIIYQNKYRAHRDQSRYQDHVNVVSKTSQQCHRPWYSLHQCLDVNCPVHPEEEKLKDVIATKEIKHADENPEFMCSYLRQNVDINLYPFYKRSIYCYNSSFKETKQTDTVPEILSGVWHDPSCTFCLRTELHSETDPLPDKRSSETELEPDAQSCVDLQADDISDILYKYSFVFDPRYIFSNKIDKLPETDHDLNLDCNPTKHQRNGNENLYSTDRTLYRVHGSCGRRHTPVKHCGGSKPFSFKRYRTPIKFREIKASTSNTPSPYQSTLGTQSTINTPSSCYQLGYPYQNVGYHYTTPQHNISYSSSPYSPSCLPLFQTLTPSYLQNSTGNVLQNQPRSNVMSWHWYHQNNNMQNTHIPDERVDNTVKGMKLHPLSFYSRDTSTLCSEWYPFYNPSQYSYHVDGPFSNHGGQSVYCDIQNNAYDRGAETDTMPYMKKSGNIDETSHHTYHNDVVHEDIEDPLMLVDSNHRAEVTAESFRYKDDLPNRHYVHERRHKDQSRDIDSFPCSSTKELRPIRTTGRNLCDKKHDEYMKNIRSTSDYKRKSSKSRCSTNKHSKRSPQSSNSGHSEFSRSSQNTSSFHLRSSRGKSPSYRTSARSNNSRGHSSGYRSDGMPCQSSPTPSSSGRHFKSQRLISTVTLVRKSSHSRNKKYHGKK